MAAARVCGVCRALLTENDAVRSPGFCPYCGSETDSDLEDRNPYAPPRAELAGGTSGIATGIPPSLGGKMMLASRLFLGDIVLISSLVLTVWIPFHLLINYLVYNTPDLDERRLQWLSYLVWLIQFVFGPIYVGGIVSALANRMEGHSTSYVEAIRFGMGVWGRVLTARFFAQLWVFLGLLAFIIPAIVLTIRFCLLDPVVMLEGLGPKEARERSTELVRENALGICAGCMAFFAFLLFTAIGLGIINESVPGLKSMWSSTVFDCVVSVLSNIITCFLFVYFWEAHLLKPMPFPDRWIQKKAPESGDDF